MQFMIARPLSFADTGRKTWHCEVTTPTNKDAMTNRGYGLDMILHLTIDALMTSQVWPYVILYRLLISAVI